MYNLILLDADKTIFDYDEAEKFAFYETLKKYNYKGDKTEIRSRYRVINSKLWAELEKGNVTKYQVKTERFSKLLNEYNLDYNSIEFSEYYLEKLGEGSFLLDGAEELCKYLSEKYKVVILTNGIEKVQISRLNGSTIKKYVDDMVVSEQAGVNKPDPYIFEYTFNKVNHRNKDKAIIIGDSLTSDILGGLNFGIDTCWVNLDNENNQTDIQPKFEVSSLEQLMKIL